MWIFSTKIIEQHGVCVIPEIANFHMQISKIRMQKIWSSQVK